IDSQINEVADNAKVEFINELENGSQEMTDNEFEQKSESTDNVLLDDSEESSGLVKEDNLVLESLDSDISIIEEQNIIVESEKEDNMSGTTKGNASDNSQDASNTGDLYKDDNIDDDLNDLLNSLEFSDDEENLENNAADKDIQQNVYREEESEEAEQDDYLSLLNQTEADDSVASDVVAINDLLNGITPKEDISHAPSDVGEVFSDALKVVSSLNDNVDEAELLNEAISGNDKKSKKKKSKKDRKTDVGTDKPKVESDKPKEGFFKRLFGNIPNENAEKDALKESLAEEAAAKKKALKKANKKTPKGKDAAATTEDSEEIGADRPGKDKISKKDESKKTKKEKKENKKKSKEIIQVIEEVEKDEGKINRVGAIVVFIFFSILVAVLLIGSNMANYTLSVKNATNYFERQKYTQAYNEVYGITIKDEDIEIYDKIMTVMYVNKQLNSYNNYYYLKDYPKALDSLLKGLERYDKYIELATLLGIKSDLDYVRSQMLSELNNIFNLSEAEALEIISYNSKEEYSTKIYEVVDKNMVK
ncbi:MAG: hypothetical protein WBI07_11450, partial [Mobilitalea sp.]